MGSFAASLKTIGDTKGLPATVSVEDGRLSINAGSETLGEWSIEDIRLEPIPTGYRMSAEGDQILIEMREAEEFGKAISRKARRGVPITLPSRDVILKPVDVTLKAAQNKFGALLPHWIFTRIMAGVVFVSLVLAIIFPGAVSLFLLAAGLLIVVFGAVIYTDPMLVAKWLPGRMGPIHVLMFGVAVLVLGVLLGVIAK